MVGWFVGVATIGLLVGFVAFVYDTAERKGNFEPKAYYQTSIMNAAGLKVGDPVKMMGFDVGEITAVVPNGPYEYYRVTIEFYVRQGRENRYFDYIWTDSKAKIASADMLGNRFVEVVKGQYGLKTVWQPDPGSKALMRLDQLADKDADKEKLKVWEQTTYAEDLIKYRKWHTLKNLSRDEVRAAGLTYARWQTWTNKTASFPAIQWDDVAEEWEQAAPYLKEKKPAVFKKASEPYLAFLADAMGPDKLKTVYPTDATKGGDYRDSNSPKPYYLDSEESEALGDVITKVADQVNSVVGKPGAIGDLVINDDIRKLFAKLDDKGFVADMMMNKEALAVMSNVTLLTSNLTQLSHNLAHEKGAAADLIMNDDLKATVTNLTVSITKLNRFMTALEVAFDSNSDITNSLTPIATNIVGIIDGAEGIVSEVEKQFKANPEVLKEVLEIADAMKNLAVTIDLALGQNPELVGNVSKLTAEIDGFMQLLSRHWLFRKAAAQQAKDVDAAWAEANRAILGFGSRAESLRAAVAAAGSIDAGIRPQVDALGAAAIDLSTKSDRVMYLAPDNPTRTDQVYKLAKSALDLKAGLDTDLRLETNSVGKTALLSTRLDAFRKTYEEFSVVHEARAKALDSAAPKSEEKPKRKFFRNPFSSRGARKD